MRQGTRATGQVLLLLAASTVHWAASCTGGGGGGSGSSRSLREQEPNDTVAFADQVGTVERGTILIRGTSDEFDVDLFDIDSDDYLNATFRLRPLSPGRDLDLAIYDSIYGYLQIANFDDFPPPDTETGSFELQPGNFFVLAVTSFGSGPSFDYELEIRFSPSSATAAPARPAAVERNSGPLYEDKLTRTNRKLERAFGTTPIDLPDDEPLVRGAKLLSTPDQQILFVGITAAGRRAMERTVAEARSH